MFYIAEEDRPLVSAKVCQVLKALTNGKATRVEQWVNLGDDIKVLKVIGYWVVDTIRIDIKVKQ